jgi:hypothetical protein
MGAPPPDITDVVMRKLWLIMPAKPTQVKPEIKSRIQTPQSIFFFMAVSLFFMYLLFIK